MNPHRQFRTRALVVGLAVAGLRFGGPACDAVSGATLPKEPCALLKPAEIQAAVAPNANIGTGVAGSDMAPLGASCTYSWGPRTREWGESALTITIIDASKGWPGMSPELLEQGILAKVKAGGPKASQVTGVGDAAAFTFEDRSSNAMAEAYFAAKSVHLSVTYHAGDALTNKDNVIALLKQAAARL